MTRKWAPGTSEAISAWRSGGHKASWRPHSTSVGQAIRRSIAVWSGRSRKAAGWRAKTLGPRSRPATLTPAGAAPGIGTTPGLKGFQDFHQRPFLRALPDRRGVGHKARFADGPYACSTGWPSLRATLTGPNWLGLPPTGRKIAMRVMDWWRREGELLRENWVLIDLLDVMIQCGLDPFDRLAFEAARRG